MRTFRVIILYVVAVLLTGAVLSPLVYQISQALALGTNLFSFLQQFDFPQYFRRTSMVAALVYLPTFLKAMGVRSWAEIGLGAEVEKGSRFVWGIIFGGACIFILTAINVALGAREFRPDPDIDKIYKFAVTAVVVAGLEEVFFRAVVLTQLRRTMSFMKALLLCSFFFAFVHFLKPAPGSHGDEVFWYSGFQLIPESLVSFTRPDEIAFQFTALFLAGLILGYSFLKKGSIYFCIGIHAGWVFMLKTTGLLTDNTSKTITWLNGSGLYDGVIGIGILLVFLVILVIYENRRGDTGRI